MMTFNKAAFFLVQDCLTDARFILVSGIRGPISGIFVDPTYMDIAISANGTFSYCVERGDTLFAYVFEGEGVFDSGDLPKAETVVQPRLVVLSDTVFLKSGQPNLMSGFC